ncbi:MAG TPA: hypothetical protein ENI86_14015 [Acidimicrobiales bacterium]|nr:hypothetical protein [Acidimicrobiales bacterium]
MRSSDHSPRFLSVLALLAGFSLLAVACSAGGVSASSGNGRGPLSERPTTVSEELPQGDLLTTTTTTVSLSSTTTAPQLTIPSGDDVDLDLPPGTGEVVSGPTVTTIPSDGTSSEDLPFLIVVHAHLDEDYQPYLSEDLTTLDEDLLAGTMDTLNDLAAAVDNYDMLANWQFSYGLATALCSDSDGRALLDSLLAAGHEIGIHTHGAEWMDEAYDALVDGCGITPTAASGLQFSVATGGDPMSGATEWLTAVESVGIGTAVSAVGLADSPLNAYCSTYDGATLNEKANALLHTWIADPSDICTSDPSGNLAIVTHAGRDSRSLSNVDDTSNDFTEADFSSWEGDLSAALTTTDVSATWGIVMALPALMTESGPNDSSMVSFEEFLQRVDSTFGPTSPLPRGIVSTTASGAADMLLG